MLALVVAARGLDLETLPQFFFRFSKFLNFINFNILKFLGIDFFSFKVNCSNCVIQRYNAHFIRHGIQIAQFCVTFN